jgi:hypothetical protein
MITYIVFCFLIHHAEQNRALMCFTLIVSLIYYSENEIYITNRISLGEFYFMKFDVILLG